MESKLGRLVLVVIGVVLMITFLLPAGMQQMAGNQGEIGTVDGQAVERDDLARASALIEYASNIRINGIPVPVTALATPDLQRIAQLAPLLDPQQTQQLQAEAVTTAATRLSRLRDDPLTLYLLLREAEELGGVPLADVEEVIKRDGVVTLPAQDGSGEPQQVQFSRIAGSDLRLNYLAAAKAAYDLALASRRHGDVVKLSRPFAEQRVAASEQRVSLRAKAFAFDDYVATVSEPSPEEVEAHFEEYRDVPAGLASAANPFGFGYQQPDRVGLQYLIVPRVAARASVIGDLSGETIASRELALFRYYKENRQAFPAPTTRPATQPATRPVDTLSPLLSEETRAVSDFLAAQSAGYADAGRDEDAAAWQDFVAVHDDVVNSLVSSRTRDLLDSAAGKLRAKLASTGTGPDLETIAAEVAQETDVEPTVVDLGGQELPLAALADPGLSGPIAEAGIGNATFVQYVGAFTLPLLDEAQQNEAASSNQSLDVNRPGPVLVNRNGDRFIFRLTSANKAAPAEDVNAVSERLLTDLRRKAAFERAADEASAAVEAGLDEAASTEPFLPSQSLSEADAAALDLPTPLSAAARRALAAEVVRVLSLEEQAGVLRLPTAGIAIAAEVVSVEPSYASSVEMAQLIAATRDRAANAASRSRAMIEDYFDPARVAARTGFEPRQ